MQPPTLFSLCARKIISDSIPFIDRIPEIVCYKIHSEEVKMTCGKTVSRLREIENSRNFDVLAGFMEGIQSVIQHSDYIVSNYISWEKYIKKSVFNTGQIGTSLMMYYITQEDDFLIWFSKEKYLQYKKRLITGYCTRFYMIQNILYILDKMYF